MSGLEATDDVRSGSLAPDPPVARRIGFWSALCATLFSIAYVIAQLAEWAGVLGSAGGPESSSTPLGLAVLLTPSLLLAPCFLALTVSIRSLAGPDRAVWGQLGVAFATIYAALTGIVYFVQLTLVGPRLAEGRTAGIELLLFKPFDSFLYAIDLLGYTCMSIAMLCSARALEGPGARLPRRLFIATGALFPFLTLQMFLHWLIYVAALWGILFPAAMLALAPCFAGTDRRQATRPRHTYSANRRA